LRQTVNRFYIIGNTQFIVVAQRGHQESQAVIRYASFKLAIKGIAGEFFQRVFENIMVIRCQAKIYCLNSAFRLNF
jgi:hypothetical protein